ncbi:MAG: hypothetical protein ACO2PN_21805 [Pyrobaculum sp.]|jgi:hypothetical protein
MKIGVANTISPISVSEQTRHLAERIGGELIKGLDVGTFYDVLVVVGPPNVVFENTVKFVKAKKKVCYWIVEGILTAVGRRRARSAHCDLSIAVSAAVKKWMEESDIHIDYIIPHEIIPPNVESKNNGRAVYIAGAYARKWPPWGLQTLKMTDKLDAFYKPEIPLELVTHYVRFLEGFGVKKLDVMPKDKHYEYLAQYSAFAVLSASEGFGLYAREALAMRMNVVAVNHEAYWDINTHPCFYSVPHRDIVYAVAPRDDAYDEYRTWEPTVYVEVLMKALEKPCPVALELKKYYDTMKTLIYQLLK